MNWQDRAARAWPGKVVIGDGYLAVVTPSAVRLFNGLPLCDPQSDFDKWTALLIAGKGTHKLVDLRDLPAEPPKPQPKAEQHKPTVIRLWNNRREDD